MVCVCSAFLTAGSHSSGVLCFRQDGVRMLGLDVGWRGAGYDYNEPGGKDKFLFPGADSRLTVW